MRLRDVARIVVLVLVIAIWMLPSAQAFELTGKWNFVFETEDGSRDQVVTLRQEGQNVSGKFDASDVKGTFIGDKLDLKFPHYSAEGGFEAELSLQGNVDGDGLKGKWTFGDHGGEWKATKAK